VIEDPVQTSPETRAAHCVEEARRSSLIARDLARPVRTNDF
jgi:hypothetical protein